MTLKELEKQLLALTPGEKTQAKRNLLDLSGQIQFAPDYDYKALRENRNVLDRYQ